MTMRIHVPMAINSDAYTVSSEDLESQDCKDWSCYNLTNRYSPRDVFSCADDSRMVMYGISDFIRNYLIDPILKYDIDEAEEFMNRAHIKGVMPFNRKMWDTIARDYKFLPISIRAIPEGSTFFPNEPIIEVNSAYGFGQLAALIEPLLVGMVSLGTARATLTRHLFNKLAQFTQRVHPSWTKKKVYETVSWLIHDFGMRTGVGEESELLGKAHLLCFNGTDSFNAAYQAYKLGCKPETGKSILALAHRIVQGFDNEVDSYENLYQQCSTSKIGSFVADCYDFRNAVSNYLLDLAKRKDVTIVVRPDSGDYLDNVAFIVKTAMSAALYDMDELNRPTGNYMKFISGDSMNYEKIMNTLVALEKDGFDPVGWGLFGVGGWLRNSCTRDILSTAYKLCAKGMQAKPVCKLTEGGKASIPGLTTLNNLGDGKPSVHSVKGDGFDFDGKKLYYSNQLSLYWCQERFSLVQDRAMYDFDRFNLDPNYGLNSSCLSPEVVELQESLKMKYGV